MFKKSSRSKNIRRKVQVADEEEQKSTQEEQEEEQEVVIRKTINKKKRPKVSSISFEEEGDAEEFQIKKSKASRRLNVEHKLRLLDTLDTLEQEQKASLYDADSLEKLRANTAALPASMKAQDKDDALLREKFPTQMNATLDGTSIPDSSAILAAKKKREQLRKNLNIIEDGQDFISLNDKNEEESGAGSRLIREEDEIGDDGEAEFEKYVGEGFTLNKKSAKQQAQQHRESVREMIDDAQDEEGQEDIERWEEDMMKFGGAKQDKSKFDPYARPPNYRPAQVPATSSIPTLSDIMSRLNVRSNEIKYTLKQEETQLVEKKAAIENCKTTLSDIDNEILRAKNRYEYFQQLLQYTDDLGEFADSKYPELEKLEQQAHKLISKKSEMAIARKRQDALDDLALFMDIPDFVINADVTMEVDEFGRTQELRNSEPARLRRRTERKQRQSQNVDIADLTGEERIREEGMWSDDQLEQDELVQRDAALEDIQTVGVENMMADVGEAFNSLSNVKDRFEAWKTTHFDDYQKAYGSLSIPAAFDFYIRMELVTYDPFSSPIDFDQMEWHRILCQYGVTDQNEDPDVEMLNKVVAKTVVTKIKSILDALDGASSRDMKYGAYMMEQVSFYVDAKDSVYKDLAFDIMNVIQTQVMHFAEIVESSTLQSSQSSPEQLEAKQRFIWSQCKYIKTLTSWRRLLPKENLDSLGDNIVNRIIMPLLNIERDGDIQQEVLSLLSRLKK